MPFNRMRSPATSMVSPSMTRAGPVMSASACDPNEVVIMNVNIWPIFLVTGKLLTHYIRGSLTCLDILRSRLEEPMAGLKMAAVAVVLFCIGANEASADQYNRGYVRKDGTYVAPHYQ